MPRNSSADAAGLIVLALAIAGCTTLSVTDERELGDEFEREARRQLRMVGDPVVNDYIRSIGEAIVAVAGPQAFEYHFFVVDDPETNAFAGPGGHVYVNTGTIRRARNVSELSGVIAHEIGHVAMRHIAENYRKQQAASVGRQAMVVGAGVLGGSPAAGAANLVGGLGQMAVLNTFGREAEREADDFAVQVMPRAGYDPAGLPSFFETMVAEDGPSTPTFLSSHPAPDDRLVKTRAAIARETLPPGLRVDDNGRLEIIQRRIELLTRGPGPRRR